MGGPAARSDPTRALAEPPAVFGAPMLRTRETLVTKVIPKSAPEVIRASTLHPQEPAMATNRNKNDGYLNGAIRDRSQVQHPNGHWIKRDADTGKFLNVKHDETPFKSVRREK